MNFLDPYDIARSTTPNPPQEEQPSLNEEVNQVFGQIGRFWGGFRKQSQTALETARKDFSSVVEQAQKELTKLTSVPEASTSSSSESHNLVEGEAPAIRPDATEVSESTEKVEGTTPAPAAPSLSLDDNAPPASEPVASSSDTVPAVEPLSPTTSASQTLFSRFQAVLPPNVVSTVRDHIPETLKHASENIDLAQIQSNLLSEFQRVQGVTRAQAEEYVHKSEVLLREAVKEAGEVLRDAVKVIPPDESTASGNVSGGLIWDGTDMWMLPSTITIGGNSEGAEAASGSASTALVQKGRGKEAQSAVATRAEALLKRIKHDPQILRHDPEAEVREDFTAWRVAEVDSKEGGNVLSDEWSIKIKAALEDSVDGSALKEVHDTLVPSEMTEETFWLRLFFRSHQIRTEEEKRKALIQSSAEADEDFSWEDDEDEASPTGDSNGKKVAVEGNVSSSTSISGNTIKDTLAIPGHGTPGTASPRVSSEDSFDMVSSANISVVGDDTTPKARDAEDDEDSDWE